MATASLTAKEQALQLIRDLPEDSSLDQILQELSFARMVEEGRLAASGLSSAM